jgi:hypothetical protein
MQPEQNPSAQSPPPSSASDNTISSPSKPKGPPKWLWFVIAGVVILLVGGIWLATSLLMSNSSVDKKTGDEVRQLTTLTIGSQAYVYPCAVATEADYARIFVLDDTAVGTISEVSALPAKDIRAATSDLTKIAPASSDTYDTSCSYTLAKKGATRVNRIDVNIVQFSNEDEATENFSNKRSTASGDYTPDNIDNGTKQLGTLPSFPDTSFVKLPEANEVIPGLKATFVSGTRFIELSYSFNSGETTDNTLPRLDEYAKAIQTRLNEYREGGPTDITGRDTFVGKKFLNICQKTDLTKIGDMLGDIQFRPDEATYSSTYGSLVGSRAAQNGAVSDCNLGFNTPGDREAQAALKQNQAESSESSSSLDSDDGITASRMWPHTLSLTVNSYRTPDEAKAALTAKKQQMATPTPNGATPTIEDITGVGDGAYKYHRESALDTMFNGQKTQVLTIDDILVAVSGSDIITVNVSQSSENINYQTAPGEVTEAQLKKAWEQLRDTLAKNR